MIITDDIQITIHLTLRKLIEEKSKRDNVKFTGCQLAHALGMPRSMITKLTHPDKTKRVTNPRIDTLIKIIEFFKTDGFNITLEDLLGLKTINVRNQLLPKNQLTTITIYSLDETDKKLGQIELKISTKYKNLIGLCASKDIKPFFKAGSIFIVDLNAKLETDTLVAIKLPDSNQIQIKKYFLHKNKIILKSLDENEQDIPLMPTSSIKVIGVIVHVNANT